MQKTLLVALTIVVSTCSILQTAHAQNGSPYWSLAGNSNTNATTSKLGTTNSVPLRIYTKNAERLRIDTVGRVGIGVLSPTERLHVNSTTGNNALRVQVNSNTKLLVHSNGGTALGGNVTPPTNGLYVGGKVGIGTAAPAYLLDITNFGSPRGISVRNTGIGSFDQIGVFASSLNGPGYGFGLYGEGGYRGVYGEGRGGSATLSAYGVYGIATGNAGDRYGVYGIAYEGNNGYGVYGSTQFVTAFSAAGYFNGAVWASSYNLVSDRKFKSDITVLEHTLGQVMKLRPTAYQFKTTEFGGMNLPRGRQIGLIADEVKQVFPELVQQAVHPAQYDNDTKNIISAEVKYEGVNYQGLIPVLVASIQEQQQQIEKQQQQNDALKAEVAELRKLMLELKNGGIGSTVTVTGAYLEQNTPNPANGTTAIRYHLPGQSTAARLTLTNSKGQVLRSVTLNGRGSGQLQLNTSTLPSGTYHYTLWVDGKQADTKQLLIAK
jgi:hypothetical protein